MNYSRRKNGDAVFLNVKPVMSGGQFRRYSTGLPNDRVDSGFMGHTDYDRGNRNSVASLNSMNTEYKPHMFYRNIWPVHQFLRMLGVMPVNRPLTGQAKAAVTTVTFLYSVGVFTLLTIYVAYVATHRIKIVASLKSSPFEEAVIAYLFLVNILPLLLIPIMWWESSKIAKLLNDWNEFEILYYQISGHSVPLNLYRKARIIAITLPVLSIVSVVITHMTMVDFKLLQVVPYCVLDNLTTMLGAWWFLVCESLSVTANILAERFQRALKHVGPAAMVADYRALWLRLSKLTRDTGNAICYTFIFLCLYLFFIITLSIYGLMSQLSEGFGIKDIGLALTALCNVCLLFFVCDEAHYASFNVRTNFQKKLLMVELNWMNTDAQTEINMFIRATEMNPSNINCGGFFDVNRNLFKGLLTTMVTYLVVLLQFQISIPVDSGPMNVTMDSNTNGTFDSLDSADPMPSTTATPMPMPPANATAKN